jgi:iron complex transport system substrate-binding protein
MAQRRTEQRIVSLAPSATSILVAIGARDLIVGVSKWCADVADVGDLPRLGDCWSLEADAVAKLAPTLVIGSVPYRQKAVSKLLEQPIAFLAMNPRTLADVFNDILLLGRIAAHEAAATRFVAKIRRELAVIRQSNKRLAGRATANRPRVYCESWPHPRISSPPWVAELVEIAGGEMAVPGGQRVSDAQVAMASPDVIVLAWAAMGDKSDVNRAPELAAWKNIPAIQQNRVFVMRDELLNTPGPPLVQGARELLSIIHGDPANPNGNRNMSERQLQAASKLRTTLRASR